MKSAGAEGDSEPPHLGRCGPSENWPGEKVFNLSVVADLVLS